MQINREQEGGANQRIGTSGTSDPHLAVNLMQIASSEIVAKLGLDSSKSEAWRITSEIPDPTFGYLRGSSLEYRKKDTPLRNNLADAGLGNLAYVNYYAQNDSEMTLMCQEFLRMRRYYMRYARAWGSSEERRIKHAAFVVDKVSIKRDILEGKVGSVGIPNEDRDSIQQELDFAKNRWGSERSKRGISKRKRPLLTSTEWVRIQIRARAGWEEMQ